MTVGAGRQLSKNHWTVRFQALAPNYFKYKMISNEPFTL
jgi:hypothetical protein